jgi:predicted ATPase with chaperone activity
MLVVLCLPLRRMTLALSPATLPKMGSGYDLAAHRKQLRLILGPRL